MSVRPLFLLASCCVLLMASCFDDNSKKQYAIEGRWELTKGFRNQKETETLQGVFFQFGADGKMSTNLPVGADAPTVYELSKNEIRQKSPQEVVYTIQSASDSSLVLAMELRGIQFELQLRKVVPGAEEAPVDSLGQVN